MSDSEDDTGTELSKKERLINAWIAVGPEGKTTDVSDLTGSSRGYASDIRRAMTGEAEDDDLSFDEIAAAHEPDLVEEYRSDLADDDIDGRWGFADRLEPSGSSRPADDPTPPEPATGGPVPRSRTGPVNTSTQPPEPSSTPGGHPPATGPEGGSQPSQQPPRQPGRSNVQPSQPSAPPQSGGPGRGPPSQPVGNQPGGNQPQPPAGGGHSQPARQRQTGQQQPVPVHSNQPAPSGFHQQLAELDRQLIAQQQQATAELNSFPQGSQAQTIAISKYNLVVDLRESLRQLATVAPGP